MPVTVVGSGTVLTDRYEWIPSLNMLKLDQSLLPGSLMICSFTAYCHVPPGFQWKTFSVDLEQYDKKSEENAFEETLKRIQSNFNLTPNDEPSKN